MRKLGQGDRHFGGVIFSYENKPIRLLVNGLDEEECLGRTILPMQSSGTFLVDAVDRLERNGFHFVAVFLSVAVQEQAWLCVQSHCRSVGFISVFFGDEPSDSRSNKFMAIDLRYPGPGESAIGDFPDAAAGKVWHYSMSKISRRQAI